MTTMGLLPHSSDGGGGCGPPPFPPAMATAWIEAVVAERWTFFFVSRNGIFRQLDWADKR
jgi:hypothetical protein